MSYILNNKATPTADSPTYPQSQGKQPDPPKSPEKVLMHVVRDALMMILHAIDAYLGIEPKVQVLCPRCGDKRNIKVGG